MSLVITDETHAHARGLAHDLTGEPLGAIPRHKTAVVVGGLVAAFGVQAEAMRPASPAAQLRPLGKAAAIVDWFAVADFGENFAAANLVAKEMRRGRHDQRVGRVCRHPVDAGEMKSTDAAGLVASGAGDVVKPTLKARDRANVLQSNTARGRLLQRRHDIIR